MIEDVKFAVEISGSFDSEGDDPKREIAEWFEGLRRNEDNVRIEGIEVEITNLIGLNLN